MILLNKWQVRAGKFGYPGFFTSHWFDPQNPCYLRLYVRNIVLQLLRDQAKDPSSSSASEAVVDIEEYRKHTGDRCATSICQSDSQLSQHAKHSSCKGATAPAYIMISLMSKSHVVQSPT